VNPPEFGSAIEPPGVTWQPTTPKVKRILRKYKYPPDNPATGEYTTSVTKVLDQAELLADFWSTVPA
jgi:hypothetical protein